MGNVSYDSLRQMLIKNVVEVKFVRRIQREGYPPTRRMLCTNSYELLTSVNGRIALNYRPPMLPPQYNPRAKNLIIVYDILYQDFRQLPVESCNVLKTIPADETFWQYFNEHLLNLTPGQKLNFMMS